MPSLITKLGIDQMDKAERIRLIEEILESLDADEIPLISDALRHELDRRVAWADANPDAGTPWPEVKARILARLKK
jgi:putative addiction module component (TIGR02574 family)